jgi:hypothetical protein
MNEQSSNLNNKMMVLYVLGLFAIPRGCRGSEYQKPNVPLTATLSIKSFVGLVIQKIAGLYKHNTHTHTHTHTN